MGDCDLVCSQAATPVEGLSLVATPNSANNEKAAQGSSPDREYSIARRSLRSKHFISDEGLA